MIIQSTNFNQVWQLNAEPVKMFSKAILYIETLDSSDLPIEDFR